MPIRELYRKINLFLKKQENKKVRYIFFISLLIMMPFIFINAGHFLFSYVFDKRDDLAGEAKMPDMVTVQPGTSESSSFFDTASVKYFKRSQMINGVKQEVNILELDPGAPGVRIQPVLSHDLIYGFEKLSDMAARKNAYAAVTGGFFHEYGLPSGMVVIKGELISASTGKYPVFTVDKGAADLELINSRLSIEYSRGDGKAGINSNGSTEGSYKSGSNESAPAVNYLSDNPVSSINIDILNSPAKGMETAVYTPVYGSHNRARRSNITATVENNIVKKISFYYGEAEIPKNGLLISFFNTEKYEDNRIPLKPGDIIKLKHDPFIGTDTDAYECGSWLVRDGKSVVPEKDAWVGIMTNRDPRTAVGIKADGMVILLTVDGRQPGYSSGFTGKELAEYLIDCGARNAAMLDGGASAEMFYKGKLVSRPSYKGEERELGGGLLVLTGK